MEAGETLNLVLKSTGSEQFKGFIVRAFDSGSGNSYGTFEFGSPTSSKAKGMNCDGQTNSATSHSNSGLTSEVKLKWKAPSFTSGPNKNVEFKFSVVKDY